MSEKLYSWLLRLYPPHFREAYGAEALELFRDRSRHERGFLPAARLWLDLLFDLAASLPGQYRRGQRVIAAAAPALQDGVPSFVVLEPRPPRPGALLLGVVLSLCAAAASAPLFNLASYQRALDAAGARSWDYARSLVAAGLTAPPPQERAVPQAAAGGVQLDAAEKNRVVQAVAANLKEHYFDRALARKMAAALQAHEDAGDYQPVEEGAVFATLLTGQLRDVSHDPRLEVAYSRNPLPEGPAQPSPERAAAYRKYLLANNCTFEKAGILPGGIGYLKLDSFPDPSVCGTTARAAMASLNQARAVIFDLRDNRGGYPEMVMLIAAYLFDHPEYMYNSREPTTARSWTASPVPGSSLAGKPVYVLTSSRTFSGAEHFSFDLKMLKRATLVGEATGGATDAGVFYRLDGHFGMGIPEAGAIDPFSKTGWAVTGVEPDVKVKAADALGVAESLARSKLR